METQLVIAGQPIRSRFFLGTGKFPSYQIMKEAIIASSAHIVTVALRRIDPQAKEENILEYIPKDCIVMANTSGARNADEAIRIARLARALGCGDWIKIEVIPDNKYLLPDNAQTIKATEVLAKEGFIVMPYVNPDLADARRLRDAGAASIMPLGAPIGTNKGLCTRELLKILIAEIELPVVVDAGIGRPSHAAEAMEIGAAAVLVNTAVAASDDPVLAARAFSLAVAAGRLGYVSGMSPIKESPQSSSPLTGFLC
ncbi:MAG: thiazole synthase [Omnitrophica WOR_2 bacterium GWF2_43_52]|nr:MAG: thiazole synthase [Omnitrophica WOR_2 bacterium GWA2_44_7]OGX16643.1 MAG: thiazole synthase [Omnitrophica WOR_2 bacterium GWC2_44_8]OGX22631.1 MAG: thiazole synthase [Omnitrophica WOR_2 bacterium GWF2_43_52]OGX57843.1 MAG: thiazole synthase [Omnitrophica WOR_2 bacterium RIFOXYC2_FULL_43_9]HAH21725.1 thiazole synthase [Candidatus Omnitrophota bacterium]